MQSATRRSVCFLAFALTAHQLVDSGFAQSETRKAQLYFFTNPGCGPCRQVEPELEQLFREGYSIMKIDTTIHPDWTQRFQVTRTPTVVLMSGTEIIGRHSGFVDAATLRQWFRRAEVAAADVTGSPAIEKQQRADNRLPPIGDSTVAVESDIGQTESATCGTPNPQNAAESLALQATVRLRVDDPKGSSFATGTVIHCNDGDALVITCGHVFRDSQGKGTILAEYGFTTGSTKQASGELLYYDADARDIGLVAISITDPIQPVPVANIHFPVQKGDQIFSVGCDHGSAPTIRRSRIKNQAKYDGVEKYDIYGRPVDGRSGGGMFTAGGQLIGVCNAAVVDVDEGVYVALDTIHWQLATVKLDHLFDDDPRTALSATPSAQPMPVVSPTPTPIAADSMLTRIPVRDRIADSEGPSPISGNAVAFLSSARTASESVEDQTSITGNAVTASDVSDRLPGKQSGSAVTASDIPDASPGEHSGNPAGAESADLELIMVLRSRDGSGRMQTWSIEHPNVELVQQLQQMGGMQADMRGSDNRIARLRQEMPDLRSRPDSTYHRDQFRAQSPDDNRDRHQN